MADERRRLIDPTVTRVIIACPGCGQKLALHGLMLEDKEEESCNWCNTVFRLRFDGKRVEPVVIHGPTGAPKGPAEQEVRK